ncbi:MAG: STAS domain-containing protein, partial [Ruminococcus sp.]|nr:STAS domain-containing protein [Ruminococcus sp.]
NQEDTGMGLCGKKKNNASNAGGNSYLKIDTLKDVAEYTLMLEGRIDTNTSPELQSKVTEVVDDAKKLIFDFGKVDYISSAGLRVLLGSAQAMEDKGEMVVRNLTQSVRDIFLLTGFNQMFNI